jgi:hypothetical protein
VFTTFRHSCFFVERVAAEPSRHGAVAHPRHSQLIRIVAVSLLFMLSSIHFRSSCSYLRRVFALCPFCRPIARSPWLALGVVENWRRLISVLPFATPTRGATVSICSAKALTFFEDCVVVYHALIIVSGDVTSLFGHLPVFVFAWVLILFIFFLFFSN